MTHSEPTEADRTREAALEAIRDTEAARAAFAEAAKRRAAALTAANRAGNSWKLLGSLLAKPVSAQRAQQLGTDPDVLKSKRSPQRDEAEEG